MAGTVAASSAQSDKLTAAMTKSNTAYSSQESKHKGSFSLSKTTGFGCVTTASSASKIARSSGQASVSAFSNEISCIKSVTAFWLATEARAAALITPLTGSKHGK